VRIATARHQAKNRWRLLYVMTPPAAPLAIAIIKVAVVLGPRAWKVLNIFAAIVESCAFWAFLNLLFSLIAGAAGDIPDALARAGVVRVWACVRRMPTPRDLRAVAILVGQFTLVNVLVSTIELDDDWASEHNLLLSAMDIISLILCVVGLLSLIRMGHNLLEGRRAHLKFWTMKALFVANTMSFRIFSRLIRSDVQVGGLCYSSETLAAAWSAGFTAMLASAVSALSFFAFRPSDLADSARPPDTTDANAAPRQ